VGIGVDGACICICICNSAMRLDGCLRVGMTAAWIWGSYLHSWRGFVPPDMGTGKNKRLTGKLDILEARNQNQGSQVRRAATARTVCLPINALMFSACLLLNCMQETGCLGVEIVREEGVWCLGCWGWDLMSSPGYPIMSGQG
jgi:hypothetical protein